MRIAVVCAALLALSNVAPARGGGQAIPAAAAALTKGQIYVAIDAKPTLTKSEADALRRRLQHKPGVYVAVLPAAAGRELRTSPLGVAAELASRVGRPGLYVASVGGRLAAWSTIDGSVFCPVRGSLDDRLTATVESVLPYYAPPQHRRRSRWPTALGAAVAVTALVPFAFLGRARLRRARPSDR